jgi:ubiquinone/menaquinone biosynthesis C-methylase UbiE
MKDSKLGSGAFTGNKDNGNPYSGDLDKGILYDIYEANYPVIATDGNFPRLVSAYRYNAEKLIQNLNPVGKGRVLDVGSGTGIATLELLAQNKSQRVTGLELSSGMLLVAKYKFHKAEGTDLLSYVTDKKLLDYWEEFRAESLQYKDRVELLQGDVQECLEINSESMDGAIANQVMHWTELSKSFGKIAQVLRPGAEIVWNSASHFYNDSRFPVEKYGFRYNGFLAKVLEDVCLRGGFDLPDYTSLSKPKYDFEKVRETTREQGFTTTQIGTSLQQVDFQVFIQNHVPVLVKQLISPFLDSEESDAKIKEAISRAILDPEALSDTKHKYEIVPTFRSVKHE